MGYTVNLKKSVAFLCAKNDTLTKNQEFAIFSSTQRCLRRSLAKEVMDFCNENSKALMVEAKEDTRRWENFHVHGWEN